MVGGILRRLRGAVGPRSEPAKVSLSKFTQKPPSPQNAVDIFGARWASDLSSLIPGIQAGPTNLLDDPRVNNDLLRNFAGEHGDLSGQLVLELGPLEGAHTYRLERLGASVTAVEANTEAYLKCLIVKELLGMSKAQFLYGDCLEYLRGEPVKFDIIFCCGLLYHVTDPFGLIELMTARTDRIYLWTHYQPSDSAQNSKGVSVVRSGDSYTYYSRTNIDRASGVFWGGNATTSVMMTRTDIMRAFRKFGFEHYEVHEDNEDHPGGPCFGMSIWRTS